MSSLRILSCAGFGGNVGSAASRWRERMRVGLHPLARLCSLGRLA
jgi:hypothetical protein